MKSNWRWLMSIGLAIVIPLTSFIASSVSGRTNRGRAKAVAQLEPASRTPIYNAGTFTFGQTKQLLPGPPTNTLGFQDVEPEIKVDIFGNIYVTAIEGVPAGVDFWKSTDQGASFAYLGQPDGAQCPAGQTCTSDAGVGGGDDSIDVSSGGYLYVSSLWLGKVTMSMSMDGGTGGGEPGQKWEVNPAGAGGPG